MHVHVINKYKLGVKNFIKIITTSEDGPVKIQKQGRDDS